VLSRTIVIQPKNLIRRSRGSIQVEIQDVAGQPVPGYALVDCPEVFGDELARVVRWRMGGDLRPLSGKPVRLRFVLKDADLNAFQFVSYQPDPVRAEPPAAVPAKPKTPAKSKGPL
jgi:hypothetical protein